MIREKRTVNCWLLTKSKRKKGKERRKRRGRRKEEKKKKEKKRGEENEESMKKNKGNCEGKPTKPLQLPFILPIELITAFLNFQKLIPYGSASKQNYMMHTGHSCNFIDPFRCITSLSEARPFPMHYRPFLKLYKSFWSLSFQKPNRNKTKKGASRPQLRKPIWLPLRSKTTFKRGDFHLQF